jgi:hypothetical protein
VLLLASSQYLVKAALEIFQTSKGMCRGVSVGEEALLVTADERDLCYAC